MEFNPAFTKNELCVFLMKKGVEEDDAKKLQEEKVDGETFQDITENDLKDIGVKLGTRKRIMKIIHNFKQSILQNAELQDLQILGGESNLSNSLVFDIIAAGSSCTVIPTISSTTSLACSTSEPSSSSSTPAKNIRIPKQISKAAQKKISPLPPSFLSEILPESSASEKTSIADLCTEDASGQALYTFSDPKNINILSMLEEHMAGKAILDNLKTGKGICRSDINEIVRIVVRAMVDNLRTLYPTSIQKINMAKAIVRDIPELKSNREGVAGYEQFYDPKNNSGSIEWRLKTLRLRVPASIKKKRFKSNAQPKERNEEEEELEIVVDDTLLQKVKWLKAQPEIEAKKAEIFKAMNETFQIRRNFIVRRIPTIAEIIEEFPKLKGFDGALIDAEFKLLYPNAENLLEVLPEYSKKIRIYVTQKRQDIEERIGNVVDENLKAMMYLADLLPIPGIKKRKRKYDRLCHPSSTLVTFTGENSSISQEELDKHPRLLCCGEMQDEELQFFLILHKEYVDLGKCFVKAFDILYKSHKVFNVQCPNNLTIFYSFLDTMIYKINTGVAKSSVEHLNNILCCVKTDV